MLEQEIPNPILPKSFQSIWKNLWQALHWSLTSEYLKVAPLYGSFRFPAVVTTIFVRICTQWEILAAVFKFKHSINKDGLTMGSNKLNLQWVPRVPYN